MRMRVFAFFGWRVGRGWPAIWVHYDPAMEPTWMRSRTAWGRIVGPEGVSDAHA